MNERQSDSDDSANTEGKLDELRRLSFGVSTIRKDKARLICESVDAGRLEEVCRELSSQTPNTAPLWGDACLSVYYRGHGEQMDDWLGLTEDQIVAAMKQEHGLHADELPRRIRQLLIAYEITLDRLRMEHAKAFDEAEKANARISELYLEAYQVICPKCGSEDIEPDEGDRAMAYFRCRACNKGFRE